MCAALRKIGIVWGRHIGLPLQTRIFYIYIILICNDLYM
jgi:hypothetical protein